MKEIERIRWRARRGLLELDIVLGRFIETYYAQLDEAGQHLAWANLDKGSGSALDHLAYRRNPGYRLNQLLGKLALHVFSGGHQIARYIGNKRHDWINEMYIAQYLL